MTSASDDARVKASFATTQWTRILAARSDSDEGRQLLRKLCEEWYAPVLAFVSQTCREKQEARDLTHEFFAKLLEGRSFEQLERGRGRFRSYLLGAAKHFLADVRDREHAARRGGGVSPRSLDSHEMQTRDGTKALVDVQVADSRGMPDDAFFDREWAMTLLEKSLQRLETETSAVGRSETFRVLKPWLTGDVPDVPQADIARDLRLSQSALKVAIHRLRKRFREIVRGEIASTVGSDDDVDSELSYLVAALTHARRSATQGERPA
jgi:RNA polymerase sigma-70 factor (ECF subfamily)